MLSYLSGNFAGIPKLAIIAVLLLALIGAVWFWKRWHRVDKESEMVKAQKNAAGYADFVRDHADMERETVSDDDARREIRGEYDNFVRGGLEEFEAEDAEDAEAAEDAEDAEDAEAAEAGYPMMNVPEYTNKLKKRVTFSDDA